MTNIHTQTTHYLDPIVSQSVPIYSSAYIANDTSIPIRAVIITDSIVHMSRFNKINHPKPLIFTHI